MYWGRTDAGCQRTSKIWFFWLSTTRGNVHSIRLSAMTVPGDVSGTVDGANFKVSAQEGLPVSLRKFEPASVTTVPPLFGPDAGYTECTTGVLKKTNLLGFGSVTVKSTPFRLTSTTIELASVTTGDVHRSLIRSLSNSALTTCACPNRHFASNFARPATSPPHAPYDTRPTSWEYNNRAPFISSSNKSWPEIVTTVPPRTSDANGSKLVTSGSL